MEDSVVFNPPTQLSIGKLPVLKQGEIATDGNYLYLCREHGKVEMFVEEEMFLSLKEEEMDSHINQYH